jgi:hypothetical protein
MISLSDYGNQYRMLKKLLVDHLFNTNTQVIIVIY